MAANDTGSNAGSNVVDALQQKYIDLLERRIAQLEAAVDKPAAAASDSSSKDDEKKDGEKKDEKKEEKKDEKEGESGGRYRNILRKWDKTAGAHKDEVVGASHFSKTQVKDVAYTFRRIYDPDTGEKGAYSEIEVEDEQLIQVLKTEIGKYPGVNFDGDRLSMMTPFPAIIHNWEKLRARTKQSPESQPTKDLFNLLERIQTAPELETYFKIRDSNEEQKIVTFETLWTIFAPNTLVVAWPFMNKPQIFKVADSPIPYNPHGRYRWLKMWAYCWDWDGKKFLKIEYELKFETFRGTKAITELPFYPLSFHEKREELCAEARTRAMQFIKATARCKPGAEQMLRYEGSAYAVQNRTLAGKDTSDPLLDEENEKSEHDDDPAKGKIVPVNGEVISDAQAFLQYAMPIHALGDMSDSSQIYVDELQATSEESIEFEETVKKLDLEKDIEPTNDNFLILPPRILGYATREKVWGQFSLDSTKKPAGKRPEKFRDNLQLDPKYKNLIEALVASHQLSQDQLGRRVEDVVQDKGKGLVLLLHGPPGVGKTLTAETIAEATGKPLFVVSVAEIGLDASRAERNLEKLFNLATKWEAVLLVDEADVFLETRGSTSDASRNALVSVLLRVLEYYRGIIILTTNRIKSIDVAVISRIHLAIRYDDLSYEQMTSIFKYFLDQLEPDLIGQENRKEIDQFVKSYAHHYGLNGRQIRNVVSAALAAARHEVDSPTPSAPQQHQMYSPGLRGDRPKDGRLTFEHLRAVCEMTRDFQEQLKENTMQQRYNNEAMGRGLRM